MSYICFSCIAEIFNVEKMVMYLMSSKWISIQGFNVISAYGNNCFVILNKKKGKIISTWFWTAGIYLHSSVRQKLLKVIVFWIPERFAKIEALRATFVFCDVTTERVFFLEGYHLSWYCPAPLLTSSSAKGDFVLLVEMTMFCGWLKVK